MTQHYYLDSFLSSNGITCFYHYVNIQLMIFNEVDTRIY